MIDAPIRIQKITSKGQITLPASWRRKFGVTNIILREKDRLVEVEPLTNIESINEYTVFDAIRDNQGVGLKASDLTKLLKKIS